MTWTLTLVLLPAAENLEVVSLAPASCRRRGAADGPSPGCNWSSAPRPVKARSAPARRLLGDCLRSPRPRHKISLLSALSWRLGVITLMPVVLSNSYGFILPSIFAIGTALPLILFIFIIWYLGGGGVLMKKGRRVGTFIQRFAGIVMILLGIVDTITYWSL